MEFAVAAASGITERAKSHDLHDFVISSQKAIKDEYDRIRRHAAEDPGTAGDQGEENWANLLRKWLPSYFQIVTKGRILTASGYKSPQVDVLVLSPSYPNILLDKKHYLAAGVVAAFECKTTLKANHIEKSVKTASEIRRNLPKRSGTPYKELNSTIIFGLLAHSHSWKGIKSTPLENINRLLYEADRNHVQHPIECLDFLVVADLAAWNIYKMTFFNPNKFTRDLAKEFRLKYGPKGSMTTAYICHAKGQTDYFSPLGLLLSALYTKLAWMFPDMRQLEKYFRSVNLSGSGRGYSRNWDIDIYSKAIREKIYNHNFSNAWFDEWQLFFL
jgi:hypothetical protein